MENFILLATKNRGSIDEALKNFEEMIGSGVEDEASGWVMSQ